jgi:fluoride exporter
VTAISVALGGALGTWLRYLVNLACAARFGSELPYGTWVVNALGSFLLALASQLLVGRTFAGVSVALVVGTGVLGGFTTYSSFNLETLQMLQAGQPLRATFYALLMFATCLALGALGFYLGGILKR